MRRHAKASSAASITSRGLRLGSRIRGAFATRGDSLDAKGSSALSPARAHEADADRHYRATALLAGLGVTALMALTAASASAEPVLGDPCPNGDIRRAQGMSHLPGCMALEQVSPQKKDNSYARIESPNPQGGTIAAGAISPDGERIRFRSLATLGGSPGLLGGIYGDAYVATRDPDQGLWVTEHTLPPAEFDFSWSCCTSSALGFSPDLTRWFQFGRTTKQYYSGIDQAFQGGVGGHSLPISPLITPLTGLPPIWFETAPGASADGSHLYFAATSSVSGTVTYFPGDPIPAGSGVVTTVGGAMANTYIAALDAAGDPSLQLLPRDVDGRVWGGKCGAAPGQGGAISADGSRTYFVTRPTQPTNSTPGGPITGNCTTTNRTRIMLREETPGGVEIAELFDSECDRVPNPGPPEVLACGKTMTGPTPPAGGNTVPDSDDAYQGASIEGDRVYFTTSRQLANSDTNGLEEFFGFPISGCVPFFGFVGGCDLYLYDATEPEGERLTQVTGGSTGQVAPNVAALSGDGSRAYFTSTEVLTADTGPGIPDTADAGQTNLYAYDAEADQLAFVARASAGNAWAVPLHGPDLDEFGVGGDGHLLVFTTSAALTADDGDSSSDVYRYDAEADTLIRLSRAPPGGADDGAFGVVANAGTRDGIGGGTYSANDPVYTSQQRWVSDDGETIAFKTKDALDPDDTNGVVDSYALHEGQLFRLPGTSDPGGRGALDDQPIVSADGGTVVYQSGEALLSVDRDIAYDVYAVRVNGGFLDPVEPEACAPDADDGCQGPAASAPADPGALSATLPSRGNLVSQGNANRRKLRCPKGKRAVRRNGRTRCVKRRAKTKKAAKHRRAGAERRAGR